MKKDLIKILISLAIFLISFFINFDIKFLNEGLYIVSYLIVGDEVIKKALHNIKRGKVFDENFLMTLATFGAFAVHEFPEACAVMLFYQVGELFQDYAVDKSRKSIASLMDIRPDYANVLRNDVESKVDPDEVEINETIIVKPGEKVPLDGTVIEGTSSVDTKALTGESVPRTIREGNEILSGTINLTSVIKVKVTKEFGESTVNKILDLVENASSNKSQSENFITKFAKYYTPIVVIIAVLLALIPILCGLEPKTWIYRACSFLVVSCPCALVISIPLSFFGGIGGASRIGVLIKGSNYLETLANTKIAVFDKTGTLTKGVFEVQEVFTNKLVKDEVLKLAAHAENYSSHPIAISIKKAYGKEIDESIIKNVEEDSGRGVKAQINGKNILVGNAKMMTEKNIAYEKCDKVGTVIYVAQENEFLGYILISDTIKEDAITTINDLKKAGITKTIMLTGDRKEAAQSVAETLKIDEFYSDLLPADKVAKVQEILDQKSNDDKLVFVGDGINDAPVLALADVGIAMGALGSDAAIEASDIVLMTDEPSKISKAIKISKKTLRIVRENIIFAIAVKIIILILSAIGLGTMWLAVFADVGVCCIAVLNALRCIRIIK